MVLLNVSVVHGKDMKVSKTIVELWYIDKYKTGKEGMVHSMKKLKIWELILIKKMLQNLIMIKKNEAFKK